MFDDRSFDTRSYDARSFEIGIIVEIVNDSSTGGYLQPLSTPIVLDGEILQNILHNWIVGITGLDNNMVRPRWQPEPPNIPDFNVNWCAFGIIHKENDIFSFEQHHPGGKGYDETRRHQLLYCLVSFYGPQADHMLMLLEKGILIAQNRDLLVNNEMDVVQCEHPQTAPEFIKGKWLYRVDLPFTLKRRILLRYPILNLLSAEVDIHNEHHVETVLINH